MQLHDFPLFFSEVTRLFVEDPTFYSIHIRQGFDPNEWPECDAKTLAMNFHHLAESKSVEYAKLYMRTKIINLPRYEIPDTSEELIPLFHEFKKFGLFKCLGLNLCADPSHGEDIIKNFQTRPIQGVLTFNLKEHIEARILSHIRDASDKKEMTIEIPGWPILSHLIGGFNPGRVSLLVAGNGVGKTTFAINLALSAIKKFPVLFFNMEMIKQDVIDRIVMSGAGISHRVWNSHDNTNAQIFGKFVSEVYRNHSLIISDGRALTLDQIESEIYRQHSKESPNLIIVDYDQKIRTKFQGDEWQTVLKAVERLEEIAKSTNTFIMVLAQGNDNNDPKASRRSMQPASSVLSFHKDPDFGYLIEAKKNRFGPRNARVGVRCNFESFEIKEDREIGEHESPLPPPPIDSNIFKTRKGVTRYVD